MSGRRLPAGFTLLELVVVLAILAVLTTLATRTLLQVEDQHRFDASQRSLSEIEAAVLGSPEERASDGSRVASGFVADMGRLPRAQPLTTGGPLTLRELWISPESSPLKQFGVRPAVFDNGVPVGYEDGEVLVPGGWRGPYLRLPLGTTDALDGWGNPYDTPAGANPADADSSGYPRLQGAGGAALSGTREIFNVWHLGGNGKTDADPNTTGAYDQDQRVSFDDRVIATLQVSVQVMDENGPSLGTGTDSVMVRAFTPLPADSSKIQVSHSAQTLASSPVLFPAAADAADWLPLPVGRRAVRAYLTTAAGATFKSAVKYVLLQPGANFVELTIFRTSAAPATP